MTKIEPPIVHRCRKCQVELDEHNWYSSNRPTSSGWVNRICIQCHTAYNRERRRLQIVSEYDKGGRSYYNTVARERRRIKEYGISNEHYNRMLEEQSGVCAICGRDDLSEKGKCLAVDHCHKTNKIRGLLCSRCNLGMGIFEDSIVKLQQVIEYLRNNGE